jgi:hypothetical protein
MPSSRLLLFCHAVQAGKERRVFCMQDEEKHFYVKSSSMRIIEGLPDALWSIIPKHRGRSS